MPILFLKKWCHQNQGRGFFRRDQDSWHLQLERHPSCPRGREPRVEEQAGSPKPGPLSNRQQKKGEEAVTEPEIHGMVSIGRALEPHPVLPSALSKMDLDQGWGNHSISGRV